MAVFPSLAGAAFGAACAAAGAAALPASLVAAAEGVVLGGFADAFAAAAAAVAAAFPDGGDTFVPAVAPPAALAALLAEADFDPEPVAFEPPVVLPEEPAAVGDLLSAFLFRFPLDFFSVSGLSLFFLPFPGAGVEVPGVGVVDPPLADAFFLGAGAGAGLRGGTPKIPSSVLAGTAVLVSFSSFVRLF